MIFLNDHWNENKIKNNFKLEILDEYKNGAKLSDIARRRNLNASTVHYIINQGRKKVEWNYHVMQKYHMAPNDSSLKSINEEEFEILRKEAKKKEKLAIGAAQVNTGVPTLGIRGIENNCKLAREKDNDSSSSSDKNAASWVQNTNNTCSSL